MFASFSRYQPQLLSALRIVAALMFIQHGTQKIFGFPAPARGPFEIASQMGIGGVIELVGGALLLIGLFTRPVAFILSGMMAVAYFQFHFANGGVYPLVNGGELAALYCWVFLYIVAAGPGAWAVDTLRGKRG